ncbi:MAG TPA: DUF3857 domain-containing protein [Edaphobacter sp.]|nr:DUF3857 domain-containing protein [Edaphobacter sp.]
MHLISCRTLLHLSVVSALVSLYGAPAIAQQWTPPTPEELSMTSQPEVPGAPAVYLFREETTDDKLHMFSIYVRLKVLTERGKSHSNVELSYAKVHYGGGFTVEDIQGRTIHADGTIIPFTGKPYEKLIEKTQGVKVMAKVFTLPDVEVGSILEYRYKLRYSDNSLRSPDWYIQTDLWTRKSHYLWKPINLNGNIVVTGERGQTKSFIAWASVLPQGATVTQTPILGTDQTLMELNVHDIPPAPEEDYMPPISSFTYRVLFYYAGYRTVDEFWKNEGKYWAKTQDKFIGPGSAVTAAVKDLVAPTDTPDQKLHKIYAAIMKLENTRYTREHSSAEEKAQGFKEVHNTDDIWTRKRGSDDQLAALFVAMARAAGLKAYVGIVTNRDRNIFMKNYLTLSQLDDVVAIVNVDGKDQFFDPGTRFCPYGHLAWKHTYASGIRQTDAGSDYFNTTGEPYTFSRVQRVANLTLSQHGEVSGSITMTYMGDPAIRWRLRSIEGDSTSLEREIRTSVEQLMPAGIELKVASIDKLEDYEQPLVANIQVTGSLGSSTGKRVLLPGDIFVATAKPSFPHEKRDIPVYFQFPHMTQDAVRIHFPQTLSIESLPATEKTAYEKSIAYALSSESAPGSFTVRRNYVLGEIVFYPPQYANFRTFYSKMENKDQESVVLTNAPVTATAVPTKN